MDKWTRYLIEHPRRKFMCSVEDEYFNARIWTLLSGDETEVLQSRIEGGSIRRMLASGFEISDIPRIFAAEASFWFRTYDYWEVAEDKYERIGMVGRAAYWIADTDDDWSGWAGRIRLLHQRPELDAWFAAGIYDIEAIERFMAAGVDPQLVAAIHR